MYRTVLSLVSLLTLFFSLSASAAEPKLQGYGAFSSLNKDWMLMALYSEPASELSESVLQRLEIKVAPKKISPRRFRQLWLETLGVEHNAATMAAMQVELEQFFNIVQGSLKRGDTLIIERTATEDSVVTDVKLNYHNLAQLSEDFLDVLVQGLVGKHPPTQALKTGLMGQQSLRVQTNLGIRFDRLEPTLPRIAKISRWGKRIMASHP